jgi:hypothetical protein
MMIASRNDGKARRTSMRRIRMLSHQPPTKPATAPMSVPMRIARLIAPNPAGTDTRVP